MLTMQQLTIVVCLLFASTLAIIEFDIERIAQYSYNGQHFGPQRMGAAGLLASGTSDTLRRVELVSVDCLATRVTNALSSTQTDDSDAFSRAVVGTTAAVIVVLPTPIDSETSTQWNMIERELLSHPLQAPVFITRNSSISERFGLSCTGPTGSADSKRTQSAGGFWLLRDELYATVLAAEPVALKQWRPYNIVARLAADNPTAPTIAVIASYDGLYGEAKKPSAAAAALVQTARLLSALHNAPKAEAQANIVFLAAAGGPVNFAGTVEWLRSQSADFAICLDDLIGSPLVMRASRPLKDANARKFYETLAVAAQAVGVELEQKIEKVSLERDWVEWEHEHFSRARQLAVTLSTRSVALKSPLRGSLVDNINNTGSIGKVALLVAETVARLAYERTDLTAEARLIEEDDGEFIKAWLSAAQTAVPGDAALGTVIRNGLNATIDEVTINEFIVDSKWTVYAQKAGIVVVHLTKPVFFDFALLLIVLSVLLALHVVLRGRSAIDQFRSLWSR